MGVRLPILYPYPSLFDGFYNQTITRSSAITDRPRCFVSLNISLKVVQTGTFRKLWYSFLCAFHSNYGSMLHQFRDKARYWSKIVIFSYPTLHSTPPLAWSPSEYCHDAIPFGRGKLEGWGYQTVNKF